MQNIETNSEEQKLVLECIRGKKISCKKLYEKYSLAMYHTIIRMVPFKSDAEDVLQEVFIKVFQNLNAFKGQSTLGAWIKRITINTTLKHIRKNNRTDYFSNEDLPEIVHTKEDQVILDVKNIHEAIKKLPSGARVVINLYLLEGLKHKEIAEALNISESTSKSQYQRARKLLQTEIKLMINEGR